MKKLLIIAGVALVMAAPLQAKSFKRGVSENQFNLLAQMEALQEGVSWYYNWANTGAKGYQSECENFAGFDFAPMCWNGNYDPQKIRDYVKAHPTTKYLLGFNEPNFTDQANITPQRAAELWPALQSLAKELNLELVAPALNYSPNAPYQNPVTWMDEFVALVGKDAFDHVAVHNYGGLGVMKNLCTTFHERYGKPVWVTEFCYWPGGACAVAVDPITQIGSMVECVEWLEQTPWIHRYAWFKAVGQHTTSPSNPNPSYGLIINKNGFGPRELSPQGKVYVYMSDFNPDQWFGAGQVIPATEYCKRTLAALAPGTAADAPKPIEISAFSSGATLDYQVDVPADGAYTLTMTVSGVGEPVRFDPCIGIQDVTDGGNEILVEPVRFSLPGSDTEYVTRTYDINLKAGHRVIRLVDGAQYQPSGIRISHLRFDSKSGVNEIGEDVASSTPVYYNLQGVAVANPQRGGVYIRVEGNKVRKVIY